MDIHARVLGSIFMITVGCGQAKGKISKWVATNGAPKARRTIVYASSHFNNLPMTLENLTLPSLQNLLLLHVVRLRTKGGGSLIPFLKAINQYLIDLVRALGKRFRNHWVTTSQKLDFYFCQLTVYSSVYLTLFERHLLPFLNSRTIISLNQKYVEDP